jgi:UDPglucose 6-dehydrogenase
VTSAAAEVGPVLSPGCVVVNKSTVPVGSADLVSVVIDRDDVAVVSNPEFLREGTAVHDFMNPDRIVIGCASQDDALRVSGLYLGVTAPVIVTDPASAELIKYASNGFLATKLSFVNAIATLCEELGADSKDVLLGMGYDRRIGHQFLSAGPGWGGSCFPKDSQALVKIASEVGCDFALLQEAIRANEHQLERVAAKARRLCGGSLAGKRVAALGLTFKAGTDDLRESPAVRVVKDLMSAGAEVAVYDPAYARPDRRLPDALDGVFQCATAYDAADHADLVVVLTEWPEFAELDLDKLADRVRNRLMLDTRNVFDRSAVLRRGFLYLGTGR